MSYPDSSTVMFLRVKSSFKLIFDLECFCTQFKYYSETSLNTQQKKNYCNLIKRNIFIHFLCLMTKLYKKFKQNQISILCYNSRTKNIFDH